MNKNLKVISSLAMAGILAATGISTVSAATTKSLGVYRKVVEGKAIVPYVLSSANDRVTVQDLNSEFGVTLSNGTTVKTGTTFNKSGEEHTVVVYGDVNSDGRVNVNDVTETAKAVFKTPIGVVKEAADVAHDGRINVNDVTTLAKFIVKNEALNISLKSEEEQTNYTYTLKVNENNIVNSENEDATKVVITPKDEFVAKEYTIKVVKEDGKTAVSGVTANFTGNANDKTATATVDFSSVADGKYIVRLELGGKTVGEVTVEKHADTTNLKANVVAKRVGSDNAVVSLESAENAKIVKIYCTIASTKPAKDDIVEKGRTITVTNNVLGETSITNNNVAASGQNLYYVLEDTYGNRTEGSVVIPNDNATAATTTIETIVAKESENKFDITLNAAPASSKNVIVTLYKDGKAIDTATVPTTTATATADFTSVIKEVGTYTVKAYVEASATEKQSATVDSTATAENAGKIVVSQLAQVTDVKVDVANSKITWKDASNKEATYKITVLEPEVVNGKYTGKYVIKEEVASDKVDNTKKEATLPAITANTSYRVQVVAQNASKRILDSEAATSNDFFTVATPATPTVDNQSLERAVKLTGITKAELAGDSNATISYAVEVYNVAGEETKLVATKAVTLAKTEGQSTYETVVDGLEAGKTYKFVLTVTINGVTKKAPITSGDVIVKNSIAINGLTVNEAATEAKQGEIYTNGTKAYINGEAIDNINVFSTEYQAILNDIVKGLKTGDKVTISGNNIKLELNHNASATTALGASIKGKNVEVIGNGYYRTLTTADKASKVVLSATNGRGYFAVSTNALNAEEVVLDGATLQSIVGTYTVKGNTTTTINGVVAKVSKDTKVTPTSGKLTVVASDSNLDLSTSATLALEISGENDLALRQTGNITINAKNGDITLTSPKATVTGNINVTIENGELNVTADTLAGAKNVVVNNAKGETTTVVANLKATAPFTTTAAVNINDILDVYAETEALDTVSELAIASGKTAKEVVDFVNGLGISKEANASIEVSNTGVVTLTFTGVVTNYKVVGLK